MIIFTVIGIFVMTYVIVGVIALYIVQKLAERYELNFTIDSDDYPVTFKAIVSIVLFPIFIDGLIKAIINR